MGLGDDVAASAGKDGIDGRRTARVPDGRRMRRWSALALIVVGLLALAGMAAAAVTTVSLRADAARQEIRARLEALTGHPVTIDGTGGYSLLPVTRLSLSNVRIGNADAAEDSILRIDTVVADFDLWQALLGRARIEHLVLVRPEAESASIFLDPASGSVTALSVADATAPEHYVAMSRALGSFLSRFEDVRTVEIRDGVFRMGPGTGFLNISNVNLTIAWPSSASAARLSGDYVWNGEPTEVDISVASPVAFLDGGRSALDFTMSAPPLSARFSGTATLGTGEDTTGRLTLSTPALARAVRWLGNTGAPVPDVGSLSIEADLVARGQSVNLRNATVAINGFSGQGAMEMVLGGNRRTSIGGTLAFARFDLSAFVQAVAPIPETVLGLQRKIPLEFVDEINLDIRISAGQATIGRLPISDLAAALRFNDGAATIDVGDASLLGGRGQGRLTIDTRQRVPAAKATASLAGVDTERLLDTIGFGAIGVSGLSDISASATGPIPNWASFLKLGSLSLDVAARGGTISGFDPAPYLVAGRRPLALAPSSAKIAFNRLKAKMQSQGSLLDVKSIDIATPAGTLTAAGALSILSSNVALEGAFAPTVDDAFTLLKPIAFKVSGEWPSPIVETGPPASPM